MLIIALAAHAQQYRWMDDKGRIQYTDTPPPASAKGVQKKNLSASPAATPEEPFALQTARKNAPVKLYSSPDCGEWCESARALLNRRGIPFNEVSVSDAAQLDDLQFRSERLGEVYAQKLAALDELKQSLLHQAFSGALTSGKLAA